MLAFREPHAVQFEGGTSPLCEKSVVSVYKSFCHISNGKAADISRNIRTKYSTTSRATLMKM